MDIEISREGMVGIIEINRPPLNFFDYDLIRDIADTLEEFDRDAGLRAVVLGAKGKAFCAGANFSNGPSRGPSIYDHGLRIFAAGKPIVAAVHGAAIGGGLGVAMAADFRVTCAEARFSANFARIGYHPGFGLTETLPDAVGKANAQLMFYTGRRFTGEEAVAMGLAQKLVPQEEVRSAAIALAAEIAECAPLGLAATRATMRRGLTERVHKAMDHERAEQLKLRDTEDFREGVKASAERRPGNFVGR
ncbi:enoyl-CoA hydratase/isomerase family protein [Rhodovarius crocodyli]|uniref:Enoyl-CoA hydratase/isomerase family protein n=1 Tax=Rhodovarius crocodyli TaxID=1979269 RepID=A0A437M2E7_9PROT|nr:enoyl-CoA hydratase/isomerase family protein [Rhodovarius crocodyli]RVT91723.1 enoyl-CoA hydratase/isomerase family protein [Rhodovarius crocodyli]